MSDSKTRTVLTKGHQKGWLIVLLYGVSTILGSFNAELSHFDKFQTTQFSIIFVYTQLNVKTVLFQTIQFSISIQFQCQKQL